MPTLRRKLAALIGAVGLLTTAVLIGPAAQAQGYPPGSTVPSCTPGNVNAGTVRVGQTITFTLCGSFTAGATITITVNGAVVITKTPTNGAVVVVVTVLSTTVLIIGDPVNAAAVCGTNTVVATGAGNPGRSTGVFNLLCTSGTTTGGGNLAFTGTDAAGLVLVGLVLIGAGTAIVVVMRRRREQSV